MRRGPGSPTLPPRAEWDPGAAWDESIENAFERLLGDPTSATAGIARHLSAEEIRGERCSYCGRPARSSILELTHRVRVLLCEACRPSAGRSSPTPSPE